MLAYFLNCSNKNLGKNVKKLYFAVLKIDNNTHLNTCRQVVTLYVIARYMIAHKANEFVEPLK